MTEKLELTQEARDAAIEATLKFLISRAAANDDRSEHRRLLGICEHHILNNLLKSDANGPDKTAASHLIKKLCRSS
ncbi:hypothetical protein [Hyphomicrobium sp. DY-1]|uniref:hypothetical protein n=1 Tax=Hyphomicrobium sp. DY-1 TaxID=3075650 RepID=UPI0039C35DB9